MPDPAYAEPDNTTHIPDARKGGHTGERPHQVKPEGPTGWGTHGAGPARQPEPGGNYDEAPLSDSKLDELELACSRARAAALAPRKQPEHHSELMAGKWQTLLMFA